MTTNVEIPDALDETIEEVYEDLGYASKSEFVRDGARRLLEEKGKW